MHNYEDLTRSCRDALQRGQTKDALDHLYALHRYVGEELHREIKQLFRQREIPEKMETDDKREAINQHIEQLLARCEKELEGKAG